MRVRLKQVFVTAVAVATAASWSPAVAQSGDVVLRLKNSDVEFSGQLKSFDGRLYVIEARSFGMLSLEADAYECAGQNCAELVRTAAAPVAQATVDFAAGAGPAAIDRFAIHGSDAVGRELMPALLRDFAKSRGGSVRQFVGANPGEVQFRLLDDKGAPAAIVDIARMDSADALKSLSQGTAAIAMASRQADGEESSVIAAGLKTASIAEAESVLALDGLAVVVAPDHPAKELSIEKLGGIFSGAIKDWSEAGLPAGPIKVYAGGDGSASSGAFSDLILKPRQLSLSASVQRISSEAELADAVARDRNAIGITSYAFLRNARPLDVTGSCGLTWRPSEFSIKSEEYPLSRRVYLYASPARGAAADLVRFASSGPAQATIAESAFMNQTVVEAPFDEQGVRAGAWLGKPDVNPYERVLAQKLVGEIKDAKRLSLTLRFSLGSSLLDAKARQDLLRLKDLVQSPALKDKTIMLAGFTDSIGLPQNNHGLAWRRAVQVREDLLALLPPGAIDPVRITATGFGAVMPVACNDSPEAMNRNRRVEVWIRDRAPTPQLAEQPPPRITPNRKTRKRPKGAT